MKNLMTAMVLLGVLLFSGTAFAQDGETKSKFYNFDDMLIDGQLKIPPGIKSDVVEKAKFNRLLSLKKSFLPKIRETAEEKALQ